MRFFFGFLLALGLLFSNGVADGFKFNKSPTTQPELVQKGEGKEFCPVCGMSLKGFYKTSHASHLTDGNATQYCSLRCLIYDAKHRGVSLVVDAKVVDVKTDRLISAKDAFYVVGSKVPGTMAKISKLAFLSQADANEFMAKFGGEIKDFDYVVKIAKESMLNDDFDRKNKMVGNRIPIGKKIYEENCTKISPRDFKFIHQMKDEIWKNCKSINEYQAQSIARYLWDVVRMDNMNGKKIQIKESDECPVCNMYPHRYPKWITKVYYKDGDSEKYFAFDGAKDMFKYIITPTAYGAKTMDRPIKVEVTDYATWFAVDGTKAFYVVGSEVLGPMGNELVPFANEVDAKNFKEAFKGKEILKFDEITNALLCELDGVKCR